MKYVMLIGIAFLTVLCPNEGLGMSVGFDQLVYSIQPGQQFAVQIQIDPVPDPGLFSMGVRVKFDDLDAMVNSLDDIILPDAINSDGLFGDPLKEIGTGPDGLAYAGADGAVVEFQPYEEPLLLTVLLQDKTTPSQAPRSYDLQLDFFFPDLANFVNFNAESLDDQILFGSARVDVNVSQGVIPEPATLTGMLILLGTSLIPRFRKRRRS